MDLPFLPWIGLMGGSDMEDEEEHKYQPILYSLMTTKNWETQNVMMTLMISDAIARFAGARMKEEGPMPDSSTSVDYGDPTMLMKVTPGNTVTPLPLQQLDPASKEVSAILSAQIDKSTVSRILQNAELPSGLAFSTLNLATQTAVGALKPAKELSETGLSEVFTLMLLWVEHTGNDLYAYGFQKDDSGANYVIRADEIDPSNIYIETELTPDVPTDRLSRINGARLAKDFGYSDEAALEDMGVMNPQKMMEEKMLEDLVKTQFQAIQQGIIGQAQMALQMQAAQFQQAQQAAAQGPQGNEWPQTQGQPVMGGAPGGPGFNPAEGGLPPAQGAPEVTRENATGQTMGGEEGFV